MKEKESLGLTECESTLVIKYNRPALDLSDGLTVGNGRLSANICGTERGIERIMLCGGRLYTAVCAEHGITDPTDALGLYLRAHALLGQSGTAAAEHGKAADGNKKAGSAVENAPAENTFTENTSAENAVIAEAPAESMFMSAGILTLTELDASGSPISGGDYIRRLDLRDGTVKIGRTVSGLTVKREFFASQSEPRCLCIRLSASKPIAWRIELSDIYADPEADIRADAAAASLSAVGSCRNGTRFAELLHIESTDGRISAEGGVLTVSGTKTVTAYFGIESGAAPDASPADASRNTQADAYLNTHPETRRNTHPNANPNVNTDVLMPTLPVGSYETALGEHKRPYAELFGSFDLNISVSASERTETERMTLDALLSDYRAGRYGTIVPVLYLNLGRYLLISSAGVLPLPPLGIWNGIAVPPALRHRRGRMCDVSAMAELLLSEQGGVISLLPSLPDAWHTGKAGGFRCAGGHTVDIEWKDGTVRRVTVTAGSGGELILRVRGLRTCSATSASLRADVTISGDTARMNLTAGSRYFLELSCTKE